MRYLIVGAGIAGHAAAEAIRAIDATAEVTLIGQEVIRPYHRPPLSKAFLRREIGTGEISVVPGDWYARHGVRLVTGRRVQALDLGRRRALLDDGSSLRWQECLLAMGLTAAPLEVEGSKLAGVYPLRTLGDAQAIMTRVTQAEIEGRTHPGGRGRVVVIGSGLLGVEVAASLRSRGLWVDLVSDRPLPLAHVAGEAVGRFVRQLLVDRGVSLHPENPPVRLAGDGRVQRVELAGGENLHCDLVVTAIGATLDRRLLQGTPVHAGRVVICDAHGRTNVPGLWAAGDCSAVTDNRFEKVVSAGHWDFARLSGLLAGGNMARSQLAMPLERWQELPGWHSEMFGLHLWSWGLPRLVDRRIVRGSVNVESPAFAEIGVDAGGRICHVVTVGREQEHASLRRLVLERTPVEGREEALRDPEQELG